MFISPMLLNKLDEPPIDDSGFITELKYDGIRLVVSKLNNSTTLYTRHNNNVTALFPELASLPLPNGTVLDGELIAIDDNGKPDFELMMKRFKSIKLKESIKIQYVVFDLLYYNGAAVTSLPLLERKELLSSVIPEDNPVIVETQYFHGQAIPYFNAVKEHDLEGIVIKKIHSTYKKSTRSNNWLKIINYKFQTVYITGLRKEKFGLLLSDYDGRNIGLMEYAPKHIRQEIYQSYLNYRINETDKFIYLEPYFKCVVKYRNLTKNQLLRIPSFDHWAD
ncbi:ATP-dependent DNA ligase [Bacillus sp. TS-2]|nr:ATP-dependent DNA ligase [Bacillus sp. TS-2]